MTRKTETIEHLDASIARWKTRLKRAMTMIDKLEKKRKRLAAKPAVARQLAKQEKVVVFEPEPIRPEPMHIEQHVVEIKQEPIDTSIPAFLRRGIAAQKAVDEVIADQIREEQATTKKAKAQGRIAKMKAKKAGDLKKMPLSGKAALDHIDNG